MRTGPSLERRAPPRWSVLVAPRPRNTHPLVVVLASVFVLVIGFVLVAIPAFVVAALGDDRGLSYEQANLEKVGLERLVQRFGRLDGLSA
jgi:hypothetical protein